MATQQAQGLSSEAAKIRLSQDGPNQLVKESKTGPWLRVLKILSEPMLILLGIATAVSFLIAEPVEAAVLALMIGFIVLTTIYQEGKAEKALRALKSLSAPLATLQRDGVWQKLPASELVVGDLIRIAEGDRIPADARVVESSNLSIDESSLTGESLAVNRGHNELVSAGTLVVSGRAEAVIEATGSNTTLGQIGVSLKTIKPQRTAVQQQIDKAVKLIAIIAISFSLLVSTVVFFSRGDLVESILAGLSLAMAMIPEEFPVVLTLFFALGAWRMSHEKVLARRSAVIETLGSATVICTDKTGTLTMNSMSIDQLLPTTNEQDLNFFAGLASPTKSFDPVDAAFTTLSTEHSLKLVKEYALGNDLLAMTMVWEAEDHFVLACKGAPEAVARLSGADTKSVIDQVEKLAVGGRRILAVAGARISNDQPLPDNQADLQLQFQGLVALRDQVRPGVPEALAEAKAAGIRVLMMTGDFSATAIEIAQEIGLETRNTLTGQEIDQLGDAELIERVKDLTICSRVTPAQKLRVIHALKSSGEVVVMTGDGINDAPALKLANISIAMGLRGTDVAREASDLILTDDNFASIVAGIKRGRTIYASLKKAFAYILAIHVPLLGMAVIPILVLDWPIVLLPAMVAFIEMVVDPACTIVFQAEPADPKIMQQKPRPGNEGLFSKKTLRVALLQGLSVLALAAAVFLGGVYLGYQDDQVRTLTFVYLILANVFLILTNRSWTMPTLKILFTRRNPTVKWIVGLALTALVLIVQLPIAREAFSLGAIGAVEWLVLFALSYLSIAWFDVYKSLRPNALR
jgi:Ca2+-transporting ATPase